MAFDSKIIRAEGLVEEALPGLLFRVKLEDRRVLAHLAGRLKINRIKVIPGDRVIVEMAGLGEERGRIVRRL
ncbi:MAG: translation initiation factor IF-1 [Patescibacteria group bacterium]